MASDEQDFLADAANALDAVFDHNADAAPDASSIVAYAHSRGHALRDVAIGRRVYVRHDRIPRVRSGMGVSILSTSRGVMTDKEARRQRVGGELLCEIW